MRERRFLGLLGQGAYTESVRQIEVLRAKANKIVADSGFEEHSHGAEAIWSVLDTFPRDELFQATAEELEPIVAHLFRHLEGIDEDEIRHLALLLPLCLNLSLPPAQLPPVKLIASLPRLHCSSCRYGTPLCPPASRPSREFGPCVVQLRSSIDLLKMHSVRPAAVAFVRSCQAYDRCSVVFALSVMSG